MWQQYAKYVAIAVAITVVLIGILIFFILSALRSPGGATFVAGDGFSPIRILSDGGEASHE